MPEHQPVNADYDEGRRPRIDVVHASYFRSEKCEACGNTAERHRTFTGPSLADTDRQAKAWNERPLRHKKCELLP